MHPQSYISYLKTEGPIPSTTLNIPWFILEQSHVDDRTRGRKNAWDI